MLSLAERRNKIRIVGLLAVCLFACLVSIAWPGNASSNETSRSIRYCYNDWPPFSYTALGEAAGISIDVLRKATIEAGYDPEFSELPWKRCLYLVEAGMMDAVIDALPRQQFIHGKTSFTIYTNTFWVRDRQIERRLQNGDFKQVRLGLVSGYEYGEVLEVHFNDAEFQPDFSVDEVDNIRKLALGRVDAIIGDFTSTRVIAQDNNLNVVPVLPHHSFDRLYPNFNTRLSAQMNAVDRQLEILVENGFVDAAYREHLGIGVGDVIPNS